MMTLILSKYVRFFSCVYILASIPMAEARPENRVAPKKETCSEGQGLWLKSTGEVVCKGCPNEASYYGSEALKMPQGCLPITWGAFLPIESYRDISLRLAYLEELELFKNNLTPALSKLTESTQKLSKNASELNNKLEKARLTIETMTKEAESSSRQLLVAYSVAISVVTLSLVTIIFGN